MDVITSIGLAAYVTGCLWLVALAFRTSWAWGVAMLLLPVVALVFAVRHWHRARAAALLILIGLPLGMPGVARTIPIQIELPAQAP